MSQPTLKRVLWPLDKKEGLYKKLPKVIEFPKFNDNKMKEYKRYSNQSIKSDLNINNAIQKYKIKLANTNNSGV